MTDDESGLFAGQQGHDVAINALGVVVAFLAALVVLVLAAPPTVLAWIEPLTGAFGTTIAGFQVWQLLSVVILALGSWLLVVDIQSDSQ